MALINIDEIFDSNKISGNKASSDVVSIDTYFINRARILNSVFDGHKINILLLDLKKYINSDTGSFSYPLIGWETYKKFMEDMKVKEVYELVEQEVVVYNFKNCANKCVKGISAPKLIRGE